MGSGASNKATKPIEVRNVPAPMTPRPRPPPMPVNIPASVLSTVLKDNGETLQLDLQENMRHKQFLVTVLKGKNGAPYMRIPNISTVMISLNDSSNANLINVIKYKFPANISSLTIVSLASKAHPLKPYIDALVLA